MDDATPILGHEDRTVVGQPLHHVGSLFGRQATPYRVERRRWLRNRLIQDFHLNGLAYRQPFDPNPLFQLAHIGSRTSSSSARTFCLAFRSSAFSSEDQAWREPVTASKIS